MSEGDAPTAALTPDEDTGLVARSHRRPRPLDVDHILNDPEIHVIVCCGSGGVGKTTTAAALAVRAAEMGRHVVVLTIDPARRLAQSMGLSELDNEPRAVAGVRTGPDRGHLDAMMLDMKRTFDEIVLAHADADRAQEILDNSFYQALSSSFAGTQEYMAMEKLGQLRSTGDWDLVVVDTPPSRSALDFLDAPDRLGSFLDSRLLRILMAPARTTGRGAAKVMGAGVSRVARMMSRIVATEVLREIAVILGAFESMFGGFRERAATTYAMLKASDTVFLVIAAPEAAALREAGYFVRRLAEDEMPLGGLILNRVPNTMVADLSAESSLAAATSLAAAGADNTSAAVLRIHADLVMAHERSERLLDRFLAVHPATRVAQVPAFAEDVHDLDGLRAVGDALADGTPQEAG